MIYQKFKRVHFIVFFLQAVEVESLEKKCLKMKCFYMKNRVLLFGGHSSKVYAIEQCLDE